MKVVIIGGVAGGASAAARLRRLDENAEIIMFERGEYISFANCGLPYYIGGDIKHQSSLALQTPESFNRRFNVDVRNNSEVISINTDNKTVKVKNHKENTEYDESYDKLILSMGAEPIKPPIEGLDNEGIFTLRSIPDSVAIKDYIEKNKPSHAAVIGGGYIGIEMAENLVQAGLKVTVVEMADHIINSIDYDFACEIQNYVKAKGVNLLLKTIVKKIKKENDNLSLIVEKENLSEEINADMIILSAGVKPESKIAEDAGIALNQRKSIIVNESMETSVKGIYAVGDAVEIIDYITGNKGFIPLAGPANKQGRIAADNICGLNSKYTGTQGSSIIKIFDMAVASTGINEKNAAMAGLNYEKIFLYPFSHATYYPGAFPIFMKVIFEKESGRILGAQAAGFDGVAKTIDIIATAIRFKGAAKDLTDLELCYAPPFSSAKSPVNMAGYMIENIITGKLKLFHWHDVKNLPRDGSIQLLDVRTAPEVSRGSIEGFMHIELDTLRNNLDKLNQAKPVYVSCQSGLRSYIACMMLKNKGYDCYNLSGGYNIYSSILA